MRMRNVPRKSCLLHIGKILVASGIKDLQKWRQGKQTHTANCYLRLRNRPFPNPVNKFQRPVLCGTGRPVPIRSKNAGSSPHASGGKDSFRSPHATYAKPAAQTVAPPSLAVANLHTPFSTSLKSPAPFLQMIIPPRHTAGRLRRSAQTSRSNFYVCAAQRKRAANNGHS
jgi:hypothetical protein